MKKMMITNYALPVIKNDKFPLKQKIRILLLCDMHNQCYGNDNTVLVETIMALAPDFIVVSGDMINAEDQTGKDIDRIVRFLSRLAWNYPIYYVNGNHEYRMKCGTKAYGMRYKDYVSKLQKSGVTFLENAYTDIVIKEFPMRIYGLELPWRFYRRISREKLTIQELQDCLGAEENPYFRILLSHNPAFFAEYAMWGADLTLSGHLHGGFFRLPFIGGVISPQMVPFPKYDKGIFKKGDHYLVVSAGMGSHSVLPRFGNPTEIVLVDLERERK